MLKKILRRLRQTRVSYTPLVQGLVKRAAILHNLHTFQEQFPNLQFAPVLKSNAYGHGLTEVAAILDKEKIAWLVVDSFFEALRLRRAGIKSKILVLGYATVEQIRQARKLGPTVFTITSLANLRELYGAVKRPTEFHLKIDTGFNRQGLLPEELNEALALIKTNKNLVITGVCSHLADAYKADSSYTDKQISVWREVLKQCRVALPQLVNVHLTASASAYLGSADTGNICRLGLGLYGFDLSPQGNLPLEPALEMRTIISGVKRVPAGAKIGYDITYTAPRDLVIATVPVGYNEGMDRRLSNVGSLTVNGAPCPIVGRVSMNMTTIDVTAVSGVELETPVTVISANPADPNSVANIARQCQTIPYEILVHLPAYLRRTVV